MKANTAAGLALSGLALLLGPPTGPAWARSVRLRPRRAVVLALGAATARGACLRLAAGHRRAARPRRDAAAATAWPGRPSADRRPQLHAGRRRPAGPRRRQWLARPAERGAVAGDGPAGLRRRSRATCSAASRSTTSRPSRPLALHTAMAFVALSVGVFVIRPTVGLMGSITADGIGGATLRRLLPISLIVPLVIGWARLQGERAGYFDAITGLALVVTAMAACLMLLAFVSIAPLAAVEARQPRRRADRERADPPAQPRLRRPQPHQPRHRPRAQPVGAVRPHLPHRGRPGRLLGRVGGPGAGHGRRGAAHDRRPTPAPPDTPPALRAAVADPGIRDSSPPVARPRRRPADHRQRRRDRRPSARRLPAARGTGRRPRLSGGRLLPPAIGRRRCAACSS